MAVMLNIERNEIRMTDNLNVFFFSTHTPKIAEPINPPIINTAPNTDDAVYIKLIVNYYC